MSERVPFLVGLVDLQEGIRMLALLDTAPETPMIGLPVKAVFPPRGDHSLLVFAPAAEELTYV